MLPPPPRWPPPPGLLGNVRPQPRPPETPEEREARLARWAYTDRRIAEVEAYFAERAGRKGHPIAPARTT